MTGVKPKDSDPPDALFEVAEATALVAMVNSCPAKEVTMPASLAAKEVALPASLSARVIASPPSLVTTVKIEPASAKCSNLAYLRLREESERHTSNGFEYPRCYGCSIPENGCSD